MNLGNELYFAHPFVSNSLLSTKLPAKRYTPNLVRVFAEGTLLDAMITTRQYVDFLSLRVLGYAYQFEEHQFNKARIMRDVVLTHPECIDILALCDGQEEFYVRAVTFAFEGFSFTLDCKIKYDLWSYLLGYGADIKTTSATTLDGFLKSCDEFDYDRQRAFYMKVSGARRDILIGVSNVFPYKIFIHRIVQGDWFHLRGCYKMNKLAYELLRAE